MRIYIIKIYCYVDRRRPFFHNQRLSQHNFQGEERKGKCFETQIEWIYHPLVNPPRYQGLDKPNTISTYPAIEIRRLKSLKDERERWLHGRGRILLLPENGIRKENGI